MEESNFETLVSVLDEMKICSVSRFAIVKLEEVDQSVLRHK